MAIACASTVELCAVRATRLDSDGGVDFDADNVYIVNDLIQLQYTTNIREGEERELPGGCGCLIAQKSDDEQVRRFDLELQAGRLEPGLMEILTGGKVVESTDGPVGFLYGAKRACGVPQPRVGFEAWSKRWTEDDEQDPDHPWWHWVWPSSAWTLGQNTLSGDFGPVVVTGKTRVNTSWGLGPYGEQPASMENYQIGLFVWDGDLPVGSCDYSSVGT